MCVFLFRKNAFIDKVRKENNHRLFSINDEIVNRVIEIFNIVIEMFNSQNERKIRKVEKLGLVTNLLYLLVTGFEKLNKQAKQKSGL